MENAASSPYTDGLQHLMDELKRLDLLIHRQVLNQRNYDTSDNLRQFKGLVISDAEINDLLVRPIGQPALGQLNTPAGKEQLIIEDMLVESEDEIRNWKAASSRQGIFLPLPFLSDIFHLTAFEAQCLVICLTIELDNKYAKLYGYLHDDVTRRQPSVGLALDLLCGSFEEKIKARRFFDRTAPLFRHQLLHFIPDPPDGPQTLFSSSLKIEERIANLVLGISCIDGRLEGIVHMVDTDEELDLVTLPFETQSRLKDLVSSQFPTKNQENKNLVLHFHGPYGTGKQSLVKSSSPEGRTIPPAARLAGQTTRPTKGRCCWPATQKRW